MDKSVIPNLWKYERVKANSNIIKNLQIFWLHIKLLNKIELHKIIVSKNAKDFQIKTLVLFYYSSFVSCIFPGKLKVSKFKTVYHN